MTDRRDLDLYQSPLPPAPPPGPSIFDSRKMREIKERAQEHWAYNQARKLLHEDAAYLIADAEAKDMAQFADGVGRINAIVASTPAEGYDEIAAYAAQRKTHLARQLNRHTDATTDSFIAQANGSLETYKPGFWERLR